MKTESKICGLGIGTFLIAVIQYLLYPYLFRQGMGNISYYVILCALFVCSSVIFIFLFKKVNINKWGRVVLAEIIGCCFLAWFLLMYFMEIYQSYFKMEFSFRHRMPEALFLGILVLANALFFFLLWKIKGNNRIIKLSIGSLVAFIQAACMFAPGFGSDRGGTLFHIHAYFNPIYNAADLYPYSNLITSIYGHYSLFYILPVRILSLFGIPKVYAVMIITVLFGLASFVVLYFLLERIIDSTVLYALTVFAISYISFVNYQAGQYYQLLPHRIIFPVIILLVLWISLKRERMQPVIWLISGMAILWNLETGLVCLITVCVANFIMIYGNCKQKEIKNTIRDCFYVLLWAGAAALGSFLVLNIYNLLIGGKWIGIMDFIFPIASKDFVITELALMLPGFASLYFLEMVVFLSVIVFFGFNLIQRKSGIRQEFMFVLSVMGLGLMTYYMNRAAFDNISISHICFTAVVAMLLDSLMERLDAMKAFIKDGCRFSLFMALLFILSFFTIDALMNSVVTIRERASTVWNVRETDVVCNLFRDLYPEDTVAAGVGMSEIYSVLGWENVIPVMDYADFASCPPQMEYVKEKLDREEFALISNETYDALYKRGDRILVSLVSDYFGYYAKYEREGMNLAQRICALSYDYDMTDEDFINVLGLNFWGRYLTDEETGIMMEFLAKQKGEQGREELAECIQNQNPEEFCRESLFLK